VSKRLVLVLLLMVVLSGACTTISLVSTIDCAYPSAVQIMVVGNDSYGWLGSGVVLEGNLVVTAAHVLKDPNLVIVITPTWDECEAEIVYISDSIDCGILRVLTVEKLPFTVLGNSDDLKLGEQVFVISSPLGSFNLVTTGVVSELERSIEVLGTVPLIQTNTAVAPGSSGGPLFNANGEVVGIVIGGSIYDENLAFCLPVDAIKEVLTEALE